ncbi:response regulator [Pseudoduganella sp. DS3]|uniref:Virulence sensor protein BvgS n=1 Tax=Pseudoduganella guangdongensis TaxID=2692179 RepID=A0A6N9HIV1_9BURK|nr:ATP-binding protein [Pseudoduganella guangdongensis]MYN03518.1 response regulator [Pseudoduganella guangdongensis]
MSFPDPAIPGRPAQDAGPGAFFARRLDALNQNADKLQTWRNNLLQGLCAVAFCLGLVTMVPSIWAGVQQQNWGMIGADVVALACTGMLYACRSVRYGLRAFTFLAICYLLALVLLFSIGLLSQPYLLAVPVLCTVLLGLRAGLLALPCCGVTLFAAGYWGGIDPGLGQLDVGLSMHWTLVALNFLLVAALLVVSCAYLLHGLAGALARQRAVHEALESQIAILQAREVELRESMAARKAAELSNELKSEFLAMISHEVRTPLGGVIGMLRLAKRDDTLSADTRRKLRIGLGNAEVLLHIINDILDFSRLEAGKMPFESIDFDLPALLQDVVALLADRAETKGISLVAELDPALGRWWRGDPVRLRQVVMNLVGNGVKFTERGEVRLAARAAPDGGVVLAVSDTGIGIEREAIGRLFGKFEQGNAATSRKYGGAGLGLAICKLIVDTFGGQISVRSEPGAGSVFEVRLPLQAGQPAVALPVARLAPHAVALRLLCAEDGSTNQIILRELLSEMGHSVTIADDGAAALEMLARQDFDLVIMDSRMPRMDGIAALRLLRAGAMGVRRPDVPVVALTANAAQEERQRFMEAGANGFLPKPIEEASLHAEIGRQIALLAQAAPGRAELDAMFGLNGHAGRQGAAAVAAADGAGGSANSAAVRAAFTAEAPRQLAALRQGLADGDAAAVALHAHSLMGSAGLFGARELTALCGRVEALADRGELAAIAPLAGQLDEQLARLLAQLAA